MSRLRIILVVLLVAIGIVAYLSVYIVHERDQALILQFGKVVKVEKKPGLHYKWPFVQTVQFFDRRVRDYDAAAWEIPTSDQKQVVVDTFARYRIVNPLKFHQTARSTSQFEQNLRSIMNATTAAVFARVDLSTLLTPRRAELMEEITKTVRKEVAAFGVNLIDVRVKRLDLPPDNSEAIFRRMETQRRQEATRIRAEGERQAKAIRADADKKSRIIKADAERKSEIIRGEGEAKAQETYNKAYGQDPKFFEFWVSMNALRDSLTSDTTRYIGPADGDFFRFFGNMTGEPTGAQKEKTAK
jgi:membrane protease subunit HflC